MQWNKRQNGVKLECESSLGRYWDFGKNILNVINLYLYLEKNST